MNGAQTDRKQGSEEESGTHSNQISAPEQCPSNSELQGRAHVCDGCPGQMMCKSMSQHDPDEAALTLRMNAIKHKILVVSGKGGVGKSSTAAEIAVALSEKGKKVAILDVDICGPSIPRLLKVEGKEVINMPYGWIPVRPDDHDLGVMSIGLMLSSDEAPVIWRGPRKTNMIKRFLKDTYWGKLDYLIIDTPPGTSDEHLSTITALKKAKPDGAIVVTTPQELSLSTIRKEMSFCKKMNLHVLGILENMSGYICPCCGENTDIFMTGGGERLAKEYSVEFLGRVPLDPNIATCLDDGKCVFCHHKESPATKALFRIVERLIELTN